MSRKKTRLELTWIGKEERPKLEPRILLEDPEKSYHASVRRPGDIFDNMLIHGDNLLALKALEADFAGQVKCIYIDPPFNTGQAFEHYDDGLEHSVWLSLMHERLQILHRLLRPDGVLMVHLDQEEVHYLKVMLDEMFYRPNFLGQVAYERSGVSGLGQGGSFLVNTHEYILCYAKERSAFQLKDDRGAVPLEQKVMKRYNRIMVSQGERQQVDEFIAPSTGEPVRIFKHEGYEVETISLRNFEKRKEEIETAYAVNFDSIFRNTSVQKENSFQNRILGLCGPGLFSADYLVSRGRSKGERTLALYLDGQVFAWLKDSAELRDGQVVKTNRLSDFWAHGDLPKADLANEGGVDFRRGKKPETLLRRLITLVTDAGDLVLDSFAGSGSTGAVAHKLGRRWIMVELGDHCHTHVVPRLRSVIDGTDTSGITKAARWKGGGGFRYYSLAPSLLQKDEYGNWIINKDYNAAMLAEALCKVEGFRYDPSPEVYWQQGRSTETDYIFVTTQTMTADMLQKLSDEVGPDRSLLVMCKAFRSKREWSNLTVKKIPKAVLAKCEWGHDDYSLEIKELPVVEDEPETAGGGAQVEPKTNGAVKKRRRKAAAIGSGNLFNGDEAEGEGE